MPKRLTMSATQWVIIIALLATAFACFLLVQPYINAIVMAFIISLLISPIHGWIEKKLPNHPNIASLLSCTILTFIIVLPLVLVFSSIANQGAIFSQNLYQWGSHGGLNTMISHPLVGKVLSLVNQYLPSVNIAPQELAQKVAQFATSFGSHIVGMSAKVLGDATSFLVNFLLMLFVLFFLLRDHEQVINAIRHILPLSRSQEDKLLDEIEKVSKSAVMGSFLTALAQGVAGGLGMWMSGFPGLFWGTMLAFASFVPVAGTALIWIPASIYLYVTGDTGWAIFLMVWSLAVVGSIDNLLRPYLMQGSAGMNTIMIFFSLLGGLQFFGLIGLVYGPLIFAITMVIFKMYEEEFARFLDEQNNR